MWEVQITAELRVLKLRKADVSKLRDEPRALPRRKKRILPAWSPCSNSSHSVCTACMVWYWSHTSSYQGHPQTPWTLLSLPVCSFMEVAVARASATQQAVTHCPWRTAFSLTAEDAGSSPSLSHFCRKFSLMLVFPAVKWSTQWYWVYPLYSVYSTTLNTALQGIPACLGFIWYGKRQFMFQPGLNKNSGDRPEHSSRLRKPFAERLRSLSLLRNLLFNRRYQGIAEKSTRII